MAKDLALSYSWQVARREGAFDRTNGHEVLALLKDLGARLGADSRAGWTWLERAIRDAPHALDTSEKVFRYVAFTWDARPRLIESRA